MKTRLRKLLNHTSNNRKDRKVQPLAQLDDLSRASEVMEDMRECYDSLLEAAAAEANSSYEFSESLQEMGVCLLQKIGLNDEEESGKVMLMLGKVQFELQKLVDDYRSHIFQTITVPSESLINELHIVEEMKHQCDEKREYYEYMRARYKEKGRSKSGKGENFSSQQLQAAKDELDEEATLFVFRLKSLKQGQSRSLLTQAARHHAAQLSFFRKALKTLEAVEPHVKLVTQQQHIDYQFSGLEDDESEDGEYDNDNDEDADSEISGVEDDGELSFNYQCNDKLPSVVSSTKNAMEMDMDLKLSSRSQGGNAKGDVKASNKVSSMKEQKLLSQSAPLFPPQKLDACERNRQLRPSATRKFHSYVLPKPGDTSSLISTETVVPETRLSPQHAENLYHSCPLVPKKHDKFVGPEHLSGPFILNTKSILREKNNDRMPPPLAVTFYSQQLNPQSTSSIKKPKLQSSSGPLTSRTVTKPLLSATNPLVIPRHPKFSSGPILRSPMPQSSTSSIASHSTSPTLTSPRISELHELPRPPANSNNNVARPPGFVGFSAPLVSKSPEHPTTSKLFVPKSFSPLPAPPLVGHSLPMSAGSPSLVTRSPSLRPLGAPRNSEKLENTISSHSNAHPT